MKRDRETRETLDDLSGRLFLIGFFSTRLKSVPFFLISTIFNVVSLAAYLIGYLIWFIAALCYPEHQRINEAWYGFAQFKEQFQAAALLGTVATVMCLVAPAFIIPATWIYTLSNTLWSIGEYHKKASPPSEDNQYSSAKQALYFRYTLLVAISSGITALASSAALLYPTTAFLVITSSTGLVVCLMAASAYYWGKCYFGEFTPDNLTHSYSNLSEQLSISFDKSTELENHDSNTPPDHSFSSLFSGPVPTINLGDSESLESNLLLSKRSI